MALAPDDTDKSNRQDEEEETEEEVLRELERLLEQERPKLQSGTEELEIINLNKGAKTRQIRIGKLILSYFKQRLIELLREYEDIFALSYRDMAGLDIAIATLNPQRHPSPATTKENETRSGLKNQRSGKQWKASFLAVAEYPQWVANIMRVPQKDGKVRMCVYYRDLNKASPNDNFPLPHIDLLVDNTAQHSCYSFMDGFSRYNQIWMALEDKKKTTFITTWGTFCYKVIPFRLKNAGATYQRAMVTLFHNMMHKEVEVYVDDMILDFH
ncbi:hypothetical protein CR513_14276, partial [Mucuna pruriens]